MSYKFLLFDLDHTLLDFDAAEEFALRQVLQEAGVVNLQAYMDTYIPMNRQMWEDLTLNKISKQELVDTRFSRLFAYFGQQVDGKYFAGRYQHFLSQQGQTYSGAKDLLKELHHQDYRIFGATNGITKIQKGRMAKADISPYFEDIFISDIIGYQKPNKFFYDYISQSVLGFDYSRALMIGDNLLADIQGGNNAGIDTAWYNPHGKDNQTQAQPTHIIKNYQDLLDLL